jgi:ATP-dependent DNA helicase RecQ
VMDEYVQRGLQTVADAVRLAMEYFSLERDEFMQRWLPGREKELARQTTPASWRTIVDALNNPVQQKIVTDEREQTNVLVLAGPGSGKTRVLVHRIAYLVRVKREDPRGILALAYNRHAALEVRRRLVALIGDDARGVVVMTCHAFAMRLAGASFRGRAMQDEDAFREVMRQAVALLKGDGLPPDEADTQRDRLLAVFRWILVDEYQDIGPDQYDLISALAGRTRSEEDGRLSLFAVGDDDQNIYAFDGTSVEFIRRFDQDYAAKPAFLIENYRSTRYIIDVANDLITPAQARMKAANPVTIDSARSKSRGGGDWERRDPVGQGRVQILPAGDKPIDQAVAVMQELLRLAALDPGWDWQRVAVIAREWQLLDPVRCYCELNGIPVQLANEEAAHFWRLRETQALLDWLGTRTSPLVDAAAIHDWLDTQSAGPWWTVLREAVDDYCLETTGAELPVDHFIDWLVEWGRDIRRRQTGLLLLTAHRAKGLEFDHVAILDGHWDRRGCNEDADAPRRLYYVAMTRARQTLLLAQSGKRHALLESLPESPALLRRQPVVLPVAPAEMARRYLRLTPKDIDVGFPGRHAPGHPIYGAIAALSAGDALVLTRGAHHWELSDSAGCTIGRLARAFIAPAGMRFASGRVLAVLVRSRAEADVEYQSLVRCERWELVLPELVFAVAD